MGIMKINVELDKNRKEIEVLIKATEIDDMVQEIIDKLSTENSKAIVGFIGDVAKVLDESCIVRIYSANKKIFAKTKDTEYLLKMPLYEAFGRVNQHHFIRISNSEIVNFKKVLEFDLSFTGTICIKLNNGDFSYVSRRYVAHIKKSLGIGGK